MKDNEHGDIKKHFNSFTKLTMEKIEWDFREELISYKMNLWLYIVQVQDPLTWLTENWVMDENKVIAKEPTGNAAFARLWEEVERKYQEDMMIEQQIDEELERRAEERWEEYEPEYWTDYEPYLDDEE